MFKEQTKKTKHNFRFFTSYLHSLGKPKAILKGNESSKEAQNGGTRTGSGKNSHRKSLKTQTFAPN
jgi:hypothetical protein